MRSHRTRRRVPPDQQRARRPAAPPPGPAVPRAEVAGGHGGIATRAGGRIVEKPTNAVERAFYAALRAGRHPGLLGVLPRSYTAAEVRALDGRDGAGDDTTHVYLAHLTHGMTRPRVLDIKVGSATASRRELLTSMSRARARIKKTRLTLADRITGSATRGYRVVGSTGLWRGSRLAVGRASEEMVRGLSLEPGVYETLAAQLERIRAAAAGTGLAFLAASVLIAVDEDPYAADPARTVRTTLVDFAHTFGPDTQSPGQVAKYRDRFDAGLARLIEDVRAAGEARRRAERKRGS